MISHFKLDKAKLCLDCDELFYGTNTCPACTSSQWVYVGLFIHGLVRKEVINSDVRDNEDDNLGTKLHS